MRFRFAAKRSADPQHRAVNIRCSVCKISGEIDANSINEVKQHAIRLLVMPGIYTLKIRNADEGCKWFHFGPLDTRSPSQIPVKK
jgi:hypothetical protein